MAKKITYVEALTFVIENCEMPSEIKEKVEALKEAQVRKSTRKGERKPTKTQIANEALKATIVENMEANRLYTISELCEVIPFDEPISSQKMSALVRQLKEAGVVARTEEKRKAYFSLV